MEAELKRVKYDEFDSLMDRVIERFETEGAIELSDEALEKSSETVLVEGKVVKLEYNVDDYLAIVDADSPTYLKLAQVGMKLHKDTKEKNGLHIPKRVLCEKEVWTYLSFKVFAEIVKKLRLDNDDKMTSDKIRRYFFNIKKQTRTGLLFVWSLIDRLEAEDNVELAVTAFHYVDPVKAIYERTLSRNPDVFRAFVQALYNIGGLKSKYRQSVPNAISCYARMNILDAYSFEELVGTFTEKIHGIVSIS